MSGNSSNGTNQTLQQTVGQNNLPSWENSAYQNVASQAFGQAFNSSTGLPNQNPAQMSVAGPTDNFSNYLGNALNAPTIGNDLSDSNAYAGYSSNIQPGTINNALAGYQANISPSQVGSQSWNNATAQQYMNPYTTQVLNAQEQLANQQYGQQQAQLTQQSAANGALGGDRAAVAQSSLTNDFDLQQQNLQANALQNAYTTGNQAFNNDANRTLQAGVENSQLGLAAQIQNANLGYGALNAQNTTNQANAYLGLQGQEANANNNLSAMAGTNALNTAAANANLSGLSLAGNAATSSQNYAQSQLNTAYTNAMNNYMFPESQIGYAESVLGQIPNQMTSQNDYYTAQGNPIQQGTNSAKGAGSGSATKPPASGGPGGGGGGGGGQPQQRKFQMPSYTDPVAQQVGNMYLPPPDYTPPYDSSDPLAGITQPLPPIPPYNDPRATGGGLVDPSYVPPAPIYGSNGQYVDANGNPVLPPDLNGLLNPTATGNSYPPNITNNNLDYSGLPVQAQTVGIDPNSSLGQFQQQYGGGAGSTGDSSGNIFNSLNTGGLVGMPTNPTGGGTNTAQNFGPGNFVGNNGSFGAQDFQYQDPNLFEQPVYGAVGGLASLLKKKRK